MVSVVAYEIFVIERSTEWALLDKLLSDNGNAKDC